MSIEKSVEELLFFFFLSIFVFRNDLIRTLILIWKLKVTFVCREI